MVKNRFLKFVNKTNSCWNWTGYSDKDGYGRFRFKDKKVAAHRFSYDLHFGKIPEGLLVCHNCDEPSCVNPDHLFTGSHRDNVIDMWNKNRANEKFMKQKSKKYCLNGHQFDENNTYVWKNHRRCKACHAARSIKYYRGKNGRK